MFFTMLDNETAFFQDCGVITLPTRINRVGDSGWKLYFHDEKETLAMYFSDIQYGSPYESLRETVRYWVSNVKIPVRKVTPVYSREFVSKRNKTGFVGICKNGRGYCVTPLVSWSNRTYCSTLDEAIKVRRQEEVFLQLTRGFNKQKLMDKMNIKRGKALPVKVIS